MKAMTIAEIARALEMWRGRREELDAQLDALRAVLNPTPENPLCDAIEEVFMAYTVSLSKLIGDADDWLIWYWQERQMGRNPSYVIPAAGAAPIHVGRNLRTLARVITRGRQ